MTPKQLVALKRITEGIDIISFELSKVDNELVAKRTTLDSFRSKLVKMSEDIESGNMPPKSERRSGMGRVIVDSWPLAHPLGEKIICAERAYLEC
jgi:hypothetical protein